MIGEQTFIAWIVSAVIISGAWIKLFSDAEKHVAGPTKVRIRRWFVPLRDDGDIESSSWPSFFIEIFDSLFGRRFLGIRFIVGSSIATTVFFIALLLLFFGLEITTYDDVKYFFSEDNIDPYTRAQMAQWLLVIFVGNLLADYLSLIETRVVLSLIEKKGSLARITGLAIDFVLTIVIYWLVASWFYAIEQIWQGEMSIAGHIGVLIGYDVNTGTFTAFDNEFIPYIYVLELVWDRDAFWSSFYADSYRISALTTYFTSVWIWLFIVAAPIGRIIFGLRGVLTRWGRLFNVKEHPVATLGYTLALITFVSHCVLYAGFAVAGNGPEVP